MEVARVISIGVINKRRLTIIYTLREERLNLYKCQGFRI